MNKTAAVSKQPRRLNVIKNCSKSLQILLDLFETSGEIYFTKVCCTVGVTLMFECEAIFIFINPVSSSFKVKRFFF